MKLVFYGGGDEEDNVSLDDALMSLANKKPQITYIPSCSYQAEVDFQDFVRQYRRFKTTKFVYFPIDIPFDSILKREAFKSDIIHLSGGNTFYFLRCLREAGLIQELKNFVRRGGILTGLSAGAIIMTPTIDTASFPEFDRDENDENLKNYKSMGLVNFEFFPHYRNSRRYDLELMAHSKKMNMPLYACPDGCGIVVDNDSISFIGKAYCFYQGKKMSIKGNK
jgi:dipeptidase E